MTLTLSSIAQRIEALEEADHAGQKEQLDVWSAMVAWQLWRINTGDNWREIVYTLPKDHWIWTVYHKLIWFPVWVFNLPKGDGKYLDEKTPMLFSSWLEAAITDGFSESELSSVEGLESCLSWVSNELVNGDWAWLYDQKRVEYEFGEFRLLHRRQAHQGQLTPEGAAWLKANDGDFARCEAMKKNLDIDSYLTQALAKLRPVKVETEEERQARIAPRLDQLWQPEPAPPIVETPVNANELIIVQYHGTQPPGSFTITLADGRSVKVYPEQVYTITSPVYENLRQFYRNGDWQRVGGNG